MFRKTPLTTKNTRIEYSQTSVPGSMRSPYWNYFGFPSDNTNSILTREKVICNLCETAIAYNKNTSNLRTHLIAKHPEALSVIVKKSAEYNKYQNQNNLLKRKVNFAEEAEDNLDFIGVESVVMKSENHINSIKTPSGPRIIEIREPVTQSHEGIMITHNPIEFQDFSSVYNTRNGLNDMKGNANDGESYIDDLIISSDQTLVSRQSSKTIVDILVKDLLSLVNISGNGFQQLYGNIDIHEIKSILHDQYTIVEFTVREHLESLSHIVLFSLGIETFKNCEDYDIVNVYFNYHDTESNEILNVLYKVYKKYTISFAEVTKNLLMDNCVAIISSDESKITADALKDIAQFQSFGSVLTKCLGLVFQQEDVAGFFNNIYDQKEQLLSEEIALLAPEVFPKCPWTKLNFLQYILANGDFTDNNGITPFDENELQEFCNYISPMKIAMETLYEEHMPLCSLIRPLVLKMINEHFTTYARNNKLVHKIELLLINELHNRVLENEYLELATFFDPRFQQEFGDGDEQERIAVQNLVMKRYKNILEICPFQELILKEEDVSSSNRKSTLKSLFSRISDSSQSMALAIKKRKIAKTNLDVEFERYKIEICLDLEQCPIEWWTANKKKFEQLSKITKYYWCVPCYTTKYDCSDPLSRVELFNKRFILRHNTVENYLWYLHFNQSFYEKIKTI